MILDEVCELINGGAWNASEYSERGIPVIKVSNLIGDGIDDNNLSYLPIESLSRYEKHQLQAFDLVVTTVGSHPQLKASAAGRGFIIPREFEGSLLNQNAVCIRPKDDNILDKRYLGYLGKSIEFQHFVQSAGRGAANQMRIAISEIKKFNLNLPPLPTQQKIASILSAYDDLIENNLRRIRLLEEAAQRIYREWFVHLRFPGYAHTPVENGLPRGWARRKLKDLCFLTMGQSPSSDFYNENGEGLPFHQGVTNYGDRFVSHKTFCTNETRIAEEGDILCSVRAPVGRLNITLDKIIIGRGLSAIRNKRNFQSFQFYQLKDHFFQEDMIGGGSIFNSVTKKELENQELLNPAQEIIQDFEKFSNPLDEQIKNLHLQNQNLKAARDILLPRLMNQTIVV